MSRDPGRTVRIVEKISGEWIPQMGKMYTDLVGASGFKTDAHAEKIHREESAALLIPGKMRAVHNG